MVWSFALHMLTTTVGWAVEKEPPDSAASRILRTTDGGQTWYDVTPRESPGGVGGSFFLDSDHAWAMETSEQQGVVWRTSDGGQTWSPGQPIRLAYPLDVDLTFVDAQNGWLFCGEAIGMFKVPTTVSRTADGGANWEIIYDDARNEGGLYSGYKTHFVFQDTNTGWAGVGSPYTLAELVKTSDGGRTWESYFLPPPGTITEVEMFDCEPARGPMLFSSAIVMSVFRSCTEAGQYLLYITADGGQTWAAHQVPGTDDTVVEFVSSRMGWALSRSGPDSDQSELHQTYDGGQSWTLIKRLNWWADQLDFVSEQEGWAVAHLCSTKALMHTTDGGQSWQLLQPQIVP